MGSISMSSAAYELVLEEATASDAVALLARVVVVQEDVPLLARSEGVLVGAP